MAMPENDNINETAGDPEALGDAGKKALQAERARAEQAEKRVREMEAALQSATQSHEASVQDLQSQIDALTGEVNSHVSEKTRLEVLYAKGVDPEVAEFVTGATREDLEASAEKVVERLQGVASTSPATPKPDLTQGATGSTKPVSTAEQFASYVEASIK